MAQPARVLSLCFAIAGASVWFYGLLVVPDPNRVARLLCYSGGSALAGFALWSATRSTGLRVIAALAIVAGGGAALIILFMAQNVAG